MSKYINENQPVYFSYSWANPQFPDIEDDVKNLCAILEKNNIYYKRDKDNLSPWCVQIDDTEKEIGRGAIIIVVISKRYIESLHCMHEWHRISEGGNIKERVLPIVLDDANILDKSVFMDYYNFFTKRREELVRQQLDGIIPLTKAETNAAEFDYYVADLKTMYQHLMNTNFGFRKDNEYSTVVKRIKDLLGASAASEPIASDPEPEREKPAPSKPIVPEPAPVKKDEPENRDKKENNGPGNSRSSNGYGSLSAKEQALMQHFVMWGSYWIDLDALIDLLDGLVPDVAKALKQLAGKNMLETKTDKDGYVFYRIPSNIFQTLLDMDITDDADFSQYSDNLYSLVMDDDDEDDENDDYDEDEEDYDDEEEDDGDDWFEIYAKPALASVLNYGLLNDDPEFLRCLGSALDYDKWTNDAKKLLLMAEPLYQKRKIDKEDLRFGYSDLYLQLGCIEYYNIENNKAAEKYLNKCIDVASKAPDNDVACHRTAAIAFETLGEVLGEDDDRYDDAVDCFNTSIKILQRFKKYDGEYDISGPIKEAREKLKELRG